MLTGLWCLHREPLCTSSLRVLTQYLIIPDANTALRYSAAATLLALFVFGWVKAMLIGSPKRAKSAVETLAVGGAAAAAAYVLAKLFNVDL